MVEGARKGKLAQNSDQRGVATRNFVDVISAGIVSGFEGSESLLKLDSLYLFDLDMDILHRDLS